MAKKKSVNPTKREERELRRSQARQQQILRWALLAVLVLAIVGVLVWLGTRPATAMGDEVEIGDFSHVPAGSDPGPYPTDPPAGGKHYPSSYQAGFYNESDVESLPQRPEGYLVHNLEHGYVIFWYNCEANPNLDCDVLKGTIQDVMDRSGTNKLVAFPWPSLEEPLVMTSWGRIMRFTELDTEKMATFIKLNLNKSPEPGAQ